MRAMIVDLSKSMSVLLHQHLSELHFVTEVHTNGQRAITAISHDSASPIDLICIGSMLTDMDGIAFAKNLHSLNIDAEIVLFTSEEEISPDNAKACGVDQAFKIDEIDIALSFLNVWAQERRLDRHEGNLLVVGEKNTQSIAFTKVLNDYGYSLNCVNHGIDALSAIQSKDFELVVVNESESIGMSAVELIQYIRLQENNPLELPILVLSSSQGVAENLALIHGGANDFLNHESTMDECLARSNNLVRNKILFDQATFKHEKLQKLAMTDQLTGLYNRHYLFEVAPQKLAEAKRHGFSVSILIADLDKFKLINDNNGHDVGDKVLKAVGDLLNDQCRREDIVGRFGGEEFVIVLPYCNLEQAAAKADRIRVKLSQLMPAGLKVTASFGVASFTPDKENTFTELFKRADNAVFLAKDNGRNRIETSSLLEE